MYSSTTDGMSRGANACRSISGSIGMRTGSPSSALGFILGRDRRRDPAADGEIADHRHPPGPAGRDEVVEDLVGDRLVEDPLVAEFDHVVLERLQLEAQL